MSTIYHMSGSLFAYLLCSLVAVSENTTDIHQCQRKNFLQLTIIKHTGKMIQSYTKYNISFLRQRHSSIATRARSTSSLSFANTTWRAC
jgi:hypothetical protein